jgi:hypothetical protein
MAYMKHCQDNPDIGWDELGDRLLDTLANLGDDPKDWPRITQGDSDV